ncbi:MAG: hypothetical protein IJV64_11275, partial [Oscillospiraceae bacterium]|nr:hypothetical protein [Oscillospiraceae bacterium]
GKDLWNVMLESAKRLKNGDGGNGISIDNLKDAYQKYAREGWGSSESLSIEYKDGHLYDIGTKYGYGPGQTDWQKLVYNNPDPYNKAYMARVDAAAQELEVQGRDDENAARMG